MCQSSFSTMFKEGLLPVESSFLGVSCPYNPSQHRRLNYIHVRSLKSYEDSNVCPHAQQVLYPLSHLCISVTGFLIAFVVEKEVSEQGPKVCFRSKAMLHSQSTTSLPPLTR